MTAAEPVPESPSALLERAAGRLTAYAMHFEAYETHFNPKSRFESPAEAWAYDTTDRNASATQKRWVETVAPPLAGPLARILGGVAFTLSAHPECAAANQDFIDLARLILGEPAPAVLGVLRWHYGPTDTDPDPGKMWCYDCAGEVLGFSEGYICCGCGRSADHDV